MVARDLRVTLEKPLADPEDVEPAEKNDRQENAEDDSKREDRVAVFVDDAEHHARIHISRSPMRSGLAGWKALASR